jgi:hypothetical protein
VCNAHVVYNINGITASSTDTHRIPSKSRFPANVPHHGSAYLHLPVRISVLPSDFQTHHPHPTSRHFISPSTLVVLPSWNADHVLQCISKYRISGVALVPSLVFQLLAHPKLRSKETDLSSLLGIGTGAAYLPPAVSFASSLTTLDGGVYSFSLRLDRKGVFGRY